MSILNQIADLIGRGVRGLFSGGVWREFQAASTLHPDSSVRLFYALKNAGVRCRYRSVGIPWGGARGSGIGQHLIVMVHRDDLRRAREVAADVRTV